MDRRLLRILYVEDDEAIAEMYTLLLRLAGHEVSVVGDGEAGLNAAFDRDPDLVLLDMQLPTLVGLSVLEQLRRRLYRGAVWVLSNYTDRVMQAQAERDGAARWLIKSRTTPGVLRGLVDEWAETAVLEPGDPGEIRDLRGRPVADHEEAVLVADDGGSYVAASDRALALLGYERAELLGRHIWDMAPDWEVPLAQESFQEFKGHGAQTGEFVLKTKSGELLTVSYEAYARVRRGLHLSLLRPALLPAAGDVGV